ncbi:MAG: peptide chain release factor 1 [bacterium]
MDTFWEKIKKKVKTAEERLKEVEKSLENPEVLNNHEKLASFSKEHNHLKTLLDEAQKYKVIIDKIKEDEKIIHNSSDEELVEIAREEIEENKKLKNSSENILKDLLIPKDQGDTKNAIMEIRAGTGGDEAALFAGDLYKMYTKYLERMGWKMELLSCNPTGLGGFKEIIFSINGENAYGTLKYESGVHRVQRVPSTETQGRIHTSAASVVVLPQAEEVDIKIEPSDIKIDVYRSSGPGGQSVNTTDSAVRITHLPTSLVVTCQDEKSQHKNRAKAMKVLRARLYDLKQKEKEKKKTASRRSMIGSGDRSVKIRTYNFPQGRVTDHRINLTLYKLSEILDGHPDELIHELQIIEKDEKLSEAND